MNARSASLGFGSLNPANIEWTTSAVGPMTHVNRKSENSLYGFLRHDQEPSSTITLNSWSIAVGSGKTGAVSG